MFSRPKLIPFKVTAPRNYEEKDAAIFNLNTPIFYPPPIVKYIKNVRYANTGLIYKLGYIYKESFNDYWSKDSIMRNRYWPKPWKYTRFFVEHYVRKHRKDTLNSAVLCFDNHGHNYYHWLIESLPRLILAQEHNLTQPVLIPYGWGKDYYSFIEDTLKTLGIQSICCIKDDEFLSIKNLQLPIQLSHDVPNPEYLYKLREQFFKKLGITEAKGSRRIYISRQNAKRRKVSNESEVIALLKAYDFEIVTSEDLNMADKIRLFSTTRYLVAQLGAGLSNILFLPQGAHVLEFGYKDRFPLYFFHLSNIMKMNYYYSLHPASSEMRPMSKADPLTYDVQVDLESFEKTLKQMLGDAAL